MNIHERLQNEEAQKAREKDLKQASLEKQYKMWEKRRNELRKIGPSAIDPAFVRRNIDKCSEEMERITKILSTL